MRRVIQLALVGHRSVHTLAVGNENPATYATLQWEGERYTAAGSRRAGKRGTTI